MRGFIICLIICSCLFAAETKPGVTLRHGSIFERAAPQVWRSGDNIHLVYNDPPETAGNIYYLHSANAGRTWRKPLILARGLSATAAQIVGDGSSRLMVFYAASGGIYRLESVNAGRDWSAPEKVSGAYVRGRHLSAVATGAGDLHLAWEDSGRILYRKYQRREQKWSDILEISGEPGGKPLLVNYAGKSLYAVWLQRGEVVSRALDLERETWGRLEEISSAANNRLTAQPGFCLNIAAAVDAKNTLHVVWTSGRQILHRARSNGAWSAVVSRLSGNYDGGLNFPTMAADARRVYVAYLENGATVLAQYDIQDKNWLENIRSLPDKNKNWIALYASGGTNYDPQIPGQRSGYDLYRLTREERSKFTRLFFSGHSEAAGAAPVLPAAVSGSVTASVVVTADTAGALALEILAIEEDSLYLYSPAPQTLYYSGLLQEPKDFTIRGRAYGPVQQVIFSPAWGNTPLPLLDLPDGEWSVRYIVRGSDEPATLTVTVYDHAGNSLNAAVAVLKDTRPPDPPTWVRIWPEQVADTPPSADPLEKFDNDREISVAWTDGVDAESGIRCHVMGANPTWWHNAEHRSGAVETAQEGSNIFYVFAVDNVGNVSLPGTDTVYVDSIPPAAPLLLETVTSADYFYGVCSEDVTVILINGLQDTRLEITSTGNWRYKPELRDGQRRALRLQALDGLQNKSPAAEYTLTLDRTPPRIASAEHNAAGKTLRVKDEMLITARGEANCTAFFQIDGLTENIPMRTRDNIYTGVYTLDTDQYQGQAEVTVVFYDRAGNAAEHKLAKPLTLDSWAAQSVDGFESRGNLYPWQNQLKARNIAVPQPPVTGSITAPEGKGILQIDYDLRGQQSWAGLAAREFPARNYYGARPALQFWLKGDGSAQERIQIRLLNPENKNLELSARASEPAYSAPLKSTDWQKYTLFIPEDQLAGLEKTVQYALYVFNPDGNTSGVFYLDDLRVVYHQPLAAPPGKPAARPAPKRAAVPAKSAPAAKPGASLRALPPELADGEAALAPYLNFELSPPVLTRGRAQTLKAFLPLDLTVDSVYVVWGRINQVLQSTRLYPLGGNVWRGAYTVPEDLPLGEQQAVIFVQDRDRRLYKKPFYYRALSADNTEAAEQIAARFFPHPLARGKDIRARVSVPVSVQSRQVVVFFDQDQSNVLSVVLQKEKAPVAGQDIWQGVLAAPENMPSGEYTATIFCKTSDGSFIRKRTKYSVQ